MDRTISVGQLRQNPTAMIRDVKQGATYTLTDRGQPVADIAPHVGTRWRTAADVNALLTTLGPDLSLLQDIDDLRNEVAARDPWASSE